MLMTSRRVERVTTVAGRLSSSMAGLTCLDVQIPSRTDEEDRVEGDSDFVSTPLSHLIQTAFTHCPKSTESSSRSTPRERLPDAASGICSVASAGPDERVHHVDEFSLEMSRTTRELYLRQIRMSVRELVGCVKNEKALKPARTTTQIDQVRLRRQGAKRPSSPWEQTERPM